MRALAAFTAGLLINVLGGSPFGVAVYWLTVGLLFRAASLPDELLVSVFLFDPTIPIGVSDLPPAAFACLGGCVMALLARRWTYAIASLLLAVIFVLPHLARFADEMFDLALNLSGGYEQALSVWWPYRTWDSAISGLLNAAGMMFGVYLTRRLQALPRDRVARPVLAQAG